jgi:hypothetical protein
MKINAKLIVCSIVCASTVLWLGCDSLRSRHVIDRIEPTTPSIAAVEGGYDTVGRMWSEEELARMRLSRQQKEDAAAAKLAAANAAKPAPEPAKPKPAPVETKKRQPA